MEGEGAYRLDGWFQDRRRRRSGRGSVWWGLAAEGAYAAALGTHGRKDDEARKSLSTPYHPAGAARG